MNPIVISILAFVATSLGGIFALKFRDKLHLILGFSAGAVIAVAFFDLIPESISLASNVYGTSTVTLLVALGFAVYMILDRTVILHTHDDSQASLGYLGAGSLSIHSFLDGVAIGLAFKVSVLVGGVVAIAVLVHDFSDGINTVSMILKHGGEKSDARKWLVVDAIAPVLGVIVTLFFTLSESTLGLILAVFSGFFLYIGASDLLPESHHNHPTAWTTIATIIGMIALYLAVKFAHI